MERPEDLRSAGTGSQTSGHLRVEWSDDPQDPEWDRFVASHPLGHHTQASLWAQVKAPSAWETARLVLRRGETIVGGVQLLHRQVAWRMRVGYASKGPLLSAGEESLLPGLLQEMEQRARKLRIRHLTIQPADEGVSLLASRHRYLPGSVEVTPRATILLDVSRPLDEVLGQMSAKTRYNIRASGRKGVNVRAGDAADLAIYHRIYRQTADRQGFQPSPLEYFRRLWEVLEPGGHIRLALAEVDNVPVAAQLAVAFGESVVNKMSVWSGQEGPRRPNEALQWATIEWAHEAGYAAYDLEGLPLRVAETIRDTGSIPDSHRQSVSSYKLGFGGQVVVFPQPHEFLPDPLLHRIYDLFVRRVDRKKTKRFIQKVRIRTR